MTSGGSANRLLAEQVRAQGWRAGLEVWQEGIEEAEYYRSRSELSMRQTAWKVFFDPRRRDSVLVIDRGSGNAVISLAGDFERVFALYTDAASMKLAQSRLGWLGIRNVEFLKVPRLDAAKLIPESVNAAALYGVPGTELTASFCDRLSACLRPHASVWFGVPGNGIQGSLPRIVRRLRPHFAFMQTFRYDTPLNEGYELLPLRSNRLGPRARLVNLLAPFLAPAFGILAMKTDKAQPAFGPVLDKVAPEIRIQRLLMSYPFGFTLLATDIRSDRRLVIKMPLDTAARARAEANYRALNVLAERSAPHGASFPKPVQCGEATGQPFFVEGVLDGRAISKSDLVGPNGIEIQAEALNWITNFHKATAQRRTLSGRLLERLVLNPMERACRAIKISDKLLTTLRENLTDAFSGRNLNLVFCHGDYTTDNILLERGHNRICGIFDWDLADEAGLPLLDPFYFLAAAERDRAQAPYDAIFARLIRWDLPQNERMCAERYCASLEIPVDLRMPLAIMTWIYHLNERMYMAEPGTFPRWLWRDTLETISASMPKRPPGVSTCRK